MRLFATWYCAGKKIKIHKKMEGETLSFSFLQGRKWSQSIFLLFFYIFFFKKPLLTIVRHNTEWPLVCSSTAPIMFLMTHLCALLYHRTKLHSQRGWTGLWEWSALENEGGCFFRAPCLTFTEAGTRTTHEARLQRLPHREVIEKLFSISVPYTATEFLSDNRQAA